MNLREQYKEKFGKFPSSQMKEETLLKKLGLDENELKRDHLIKDAIDNWTELTYVKEEKTITELWDKKEEPKEVMKLKTRTVKGYIEPKEGDKVLKMTSRRRAYLLKNK